MAWKAGKHSLNTFVVPPLGGPSERSTARHSRESGNPWLGAPSGFPVKPGMTDNETPSLNVYESQAAFIDRNILKQKGLK
jgi:hypothetical protein